MLDNGDKIKDTRYRNSGLKIHDRIQYRIQVENTECRIPITRYKIQDSGHRIQDTRYKKMIQETRYMKYDLRYRIEKTGFKD